MQWQQRDVRPDPQALGLPGEAMQQRQLWEEVEARGDVVFAGPDRVKAERADKAHLLQHFVKTAGRIIACRVLGVQVDTKLHCRAPRRARQMVSHLATRSCTSFRSPRVR